MFHSMFLTYTSMASFSEPANKKKAADCSKRCFPSKEKAFFKAALRHLSSLKLWLKNVVIFSSCCDLEKWEHWWVKPNWECLQSCTHAWKQLRIKTSTSKSSNFWCKQFLSISSFLPVRKANKSFIYVQMEGRVFFFLLPKVLLVFLTASPHQVNLKRCIFLVDKEIKAQ